MSEDSMDIPSVWHNKFFEVAEIIRRFYEHILKEYGGRLSNLLRFSTLAEKAQLYPWTYIDYGFRVPIYRTMQWLNFNVDIDWRTIARGSGERRAFAIDLYKHILKEYTLTWSNILGITSDRRVKETLSNIIKEVLKMDREPIEEDPGAFGDLSGLGYELKACYVLIDHSKPFLPFSLMQAPITPSYIRPGASSGDLYLFEENLVVDVKRGYLDSKTGLPTYYYNRDDNLPKDLKKISNLRYLYGIRKGIGVVAEDENYIHLAIYVPWRRWGVENPLLYLKSIKLPLLVYMQRFRDRGIEPHKARIQGDKLSIYVEAYMLTDAEVEEETISLDILGRSDSLNIGKPREFATSEEGKVNMVFEKDVENTQDYVFGTYNTDLLLAKLIIRLNTTDNHIVIPVIAECSKS